MNKKQKNLKRSPWIAFLAFSFAIGALIGFISAIRCDDFSNLMPPLGIMSSEDYTVIPSFFFYGKYISAAFICCIIPSGIIAIPIITALQGYSFAVSSAAVYTARLGDYYAAAALSYIFLTAISLFSLFCFSIVVTSYPKISLKIKFTAFIVFLLLILIFSAFDTYFSAQITQLFINQLSQRG